MGVISEGSQPIEWIERTFPQTYDIVYISPLPGINSKFREFDSYHAAEHFEKVVDVWDRGWNEKLKTVHPKKINSAAITEAVGNCKKSI